MKITHEQGVTGWVTRVVSKVNGWPMVQTLPGKLTQDEVIEKLARSATKEPSDAVC